MGTELFDARRWHLALHLRGLHPADDLPGAPAYLDPIVQQDIHVDPGTQLSRFLLCHAVPRMGARNSQLGKPISLLKNLLTPSNQHVHRHVLNTGDMPQMPKNRVFRVRCLNGVLAKGLLPYPIQQFVLQRVHRAHQTRVRHLRDIQPGMLVKKQCHRLLVPLRILQKCG
ncbi:hypothetical protein D3C74_332890 [compost metagenome]